MTIKPNILKNRVVITGSTKGIGRAITDKFLENEYEVIGLTRSGANIIKDEGYYHYLVDIIDYPALHNISKMISDKKIDILVINAALFQHKSFADMDWRDISYMIDVNLKGSIFTTKAFLPLMNTSSKIFFISLYFLMFVYLFIFKSPF